MVPKSYVESLAVSPEIVEENLAATNVGDLVDWTRVQALDSNTRQCIEYLQANKKPHKKKTGHNPMIREYNRLKLINKMLHRITTIEDEERQQLVLPVAHIPTVLQALHDDMGHPGKDKTLSLLRDRFYWPGMYKDTKSWIEQCGICLQRKTPTNQRASLVPIATSSPLELACVDFFTLEKSKGGYQHILVITDHYTRYAQAIPTKSQLAKPTAEAFFNHFIVHYGIPKRIHSDQL
jgi:hypothetical protein